MRRNARMSQKGYFSSLTSFQLDFKSWDFTPILFILRTVGEVAAMICRSKINLDICHSPSVWDQIWHQTVCWKLPTYCFLAEGKQTFFWTYLCSSASKFAYFVHMKITLLVCICGCTGKNNLGNLKRWNLHYLESAEPKFNFTPCYQRVCPAPQGLTIFDNIEADELPNPWAGCLDWQEWLCR